MERLMNSTSSPQKDFFSDPSHRMPHRPAAIKPGEGQAFHDFGTSLILPKPQVKYGKASKSKFKHTGTQQTSQRRAPSSVPDDESDDEILLSSQNSLDANTTSSLKRVIKGKQLTASSDDMEIVHINGRDLPAHPDFQPSTLNALKGLRFKKNRKDLDAIDSITEVPPQSSSLDDSQDLFKPISDDIEITDGPPPSGSSSRRKPSGASSTRQSGPSTAQSPARPLRNVKDSFVSKHSSPSAKKIARSPPKPRPVPRVVIVRKRNENPESTPRQRPSQQKRDLPLRTKSPELPVTVDEKQTAKKPTRASFSRREPQEFPMLLQVKENTSDGVWSGDASSSKAKENAIPRSATFINAPKAIPLPSPLGTRQVSRGSSFPKLPPLSSSKGEGMDMADAESSDEDDINSTNSPARLIGLKPFPMNSQILSSIEQQPKSLGGRNPGFTKRTSSDDTSTERSPKKHKDLRLGVLNLLDHLDEPMEEDSIDLGYARDPSKMCPYCDEDLPSHPTPLLRHLLTTARKKSASDPRPRNRGGLRAPMTIYISVCQRHRFESRQLPIAEKKGWPKTIDFKQVPARLKKMKKELKAIILDDDNVSDAEGLDLHRGPRSKSVFWAEVKKEVKKQGSRAVAGIKGQFASFEKAQPGYYGEQGSVIIHQTLFDLFPPSTFDASLIAPLTPTEFIQRVLVPETAVRLIAQDLDLEIEDAILTLRESAQYGVAMFPDTSENKRKDGGGMEDDDEMGVADRIVMERARARRKELAEEEKVEKEMMDEERAVQRAKARESRREKAMQWAQQSRQGKERVEKADSEVSEASEANVRGGRRRIRQRPGTGTGESETDAMSVESETNRRTACAVIPAARATPQLDDSDSDSMDLFGSPKHKPSKKRGTRERSVDQDAQCSTKSVALRKRMESSGDFGWLDSGEEQESTPRPLAARQRATNRSIAKTVTEGSVLPLQIARNRTGASNSALTVRDPYSVDLNNLNADSEASSINQRLDRPRIRKGRPLAPWPMGSPSSSDRSE